MKHGLFKRIFILYAAIIIVAALFVEVYITKTVRENFITNIRENLMIQADLIASSVSFKTASSLDDFCRIMKQSTGARVTVIDLNGKVLGDSDAPSSGMENHRDRPEILEAARDSTGMSIRFSHTLRYDLLYVSREITRGPNAQGFIRLSVPLTEVDRSINLLRMKIVFVVMLVLVVTGLVSLWQVDRIRRLTKQIHDFSSSIAGGQFGRKLYLERAGEFDEIAESLNTMSLELTRLRRMKKKKAV